MKWSNLKLIPHPLFAALLALLAASVNAGTPERVLWDKRPVNIHVQVGHERIIHFPDEVRYWLPDSIKHKVSALAANGVLYIRALDVFPRTRIRVQGLSDQHVYLLDIAANDIESVNDELIVMDAKSVINQSATNQSSAQSTQSDSEDWRVRLTRYAAQQLYAPERLLDPDKAIKRVPLSITESLPLLRGGTISAVPIASWKGNGLTVTAVKLLNTSPQEFRLLFNVSDSPHALDISRLIRGNWITVTLQHDTLGPAGSEREATTLYLVSDQSFVESLGSISLTKGYSEGQNDG